MNLNHFRKNIWAIQFSCPHRCHAHADAPGHWRRRDRFQWFSPLQVGVVECRGSGSEREVVIGATGAHSLLHSLSLSHSRSLGPVRLCACTIDRWLVRRPGGCESGRRALLSEVASHRRSAARAADRTQQHANFTVSSRKPTLDSFCMLNHLDDAPTRFYGSLIKWKIFNCKKCPTVLFWYILLAAFCIMVERALAYLYGSCKENVKRNCVCLKCCKKVSFNDNICPESVTLSEKRMQSSQLCHQIAPCVICMEVPIFVFYKRAFYCHWKIQISDYLLK